MKVLPINGSPHKNRCANATPEEAAKKTGVLLPKEETVFTNIIR